MRTGKGKIARVRHHFLYFAEVELIICCAKKMTISFDATGEGLSDRDRSKKFQQKAMMTGNRGRWLVSPMLWEDVQIVLTM